MNLWIVALIVFVFNIPFGYWRANTKKFSLQWILSIHLPVPVVIALRLLSGLGFEIITYPVLIGSFFGGQLFGKFIFKKFEKTSNLKISSCFFMDLLRNYNYLFKNS